jgi:hypothetical protein
LSKENETKNPASVSFGKCKLNGAVLTCRITEEEKEEEEEEEEEEQVVVA